MDRISYKSEEEKSEYSYYSKKDRIPKEKVEQFLQDLELDEKSSVESEIINSFEVDIMRA